MLLTLRALGLGDLLTAVPALEALARAFPEHHRVLAAPAALAPLVELIGAVDELVPMPALTGPFPDVVPVWAAWQELSPVDVAVNLHGRGPGSHRLLGARRPRHLIAFAHPEVPGSAGAPAWRDDEHEVARWCRLLEEAGIPADPDQLDLLPPPPPPPEHRGATVIHPGAAAPARRWPAERWARVARHEAADGHRVLITGGPDEVGVAATLAQTAGLPDSAVVAGRTDLGGLAAIVATAERVLSTDTGIAHLATALRTPSVVLFGPLSPALWGPPADRPWHRALWAGRTGDPHGDRADEGLLRLEVDEVLDALRHLPPSRPAPRAESAARPSEGVGARPGGNPGADPATIEP